jgi:hypothetical protein
MKTLILDVVACRHFKAGEKVITEIEFRSPGSGSSSTLKMTGDYDGELDGLVGTQLVVPLVPPKV